MVEFLRYVNSYGPWYGRCIILYDSNDMNHILQFGSLMIINSHFKLVVNLCQFLLSLDFCFQFTLILKKLCFYTVVINTDESASGKYTYSSDFFVGKVVIMFLESIANFATLAINHMSKVYLSNPDLYLGTSLLKKVLPWS